MAVSRRLRFEVLRRDGHACRYCGRTAPETPLTVDHVVPVALGGSDDPTNLVAACKDCNSGKSATNPDAAVVANVADDALRWAAAIRQSAETMLADLAEREARRREFRREWDSWTFGSKKMTVPLPDTWERSVDNFLAVGLPVPLLLDAMRKAMQASKVEPDQTFRYMCGIAWKIVTEIQQRASDAVGQSQTKVASPELTAVEFVSHLWGGLPSEVNQSLVRQWAVQYRADCEGDEEGPDLATWPDELCGFMKAFLRLGEGYWYAINTITPLLNGLPDERRDFWRSKAFFECEENGFDPGEDEDAIDRLALTMAFHDYQRRTREVRDVPFADPEA